MDQQQYSGRLSDSDHDLLIRIDTRLERLEVDVRDGRDENVSKLAGLEVRVGAIERTRLEYPPEKIVPQLTAMAREWGEFKASRRAERRVWTGIAAGVGAVVGVAGQFALHFLNAWVPP